VAKRESTKGELLTQVNVSIRDLAAGSEIAPAEWEFFCECGSSDCHEQVLLTLESYGRVHDHGFSVLAAGHRVNQPARAVRLRREAHALRAQAEHQLRRARRNLAGAKPAEAVYFKRNGNVIRVDGEQARAIAAANPSCVIAVEILARLAASSSEPVDLDLPGYASDARAALASMRSEPAALTDLRAALG
jgi:hypothetical protein